MAAVAVIIVAAGLILAVVLVLGGGFNLGGSSGPPPTEVQVTQLTVDFTPTNNTCFTSAYQTTHAQTVVAGSELDYNLSLPAGNPAVARNCTVLGLTVDTSGFSLVSSDAPLLIATGSASLTFALATPTTAFNGSVRVTAIVTYQGPNVEVSGQNYSVTGGNGQCGTVTASGTGFSGFTGTSYSDSALVFSISPQVPCSANQLTIDGTSGFSIGATNLPVSLPIDSFTSITFTLVLPPTPYHGVLNFTLTLAPS